MTGVDLSIADVLAVLGGLLTLVAILSGAAVYLRSRYRQTNERELEKYAQLLERQRDEARADARAIQEKYEQVIREMGIVNGKLCLLQDMIMRQCRSYLADPATGGCRHCDMGLNYGQMPVHAEAGA